MPSNPNGFIVIIEGVPRGREDVAPRLCAKIFNVPHPRPTVDMSGGEFVSMSFLVTMTSIDMSKLADFVRDVEEEFAKK
jgi:hypothetical protein